MTVSMVRTKIPSGPPREEGEPGEVRPRCLSAASLAAGPASLSNEGTLLCPLPDVHQESRSPVDGDTFRPEEVRTGAKARSGNGRCVNATCNRLPRDEPRTPSSVLAVEVAAGLMEYPHDVDSGGG